MKFFLSIAVVVSTVLQSSVGQRCSEGNFFDKKSKTCLPCSECSPLEVVEIKCTRNSDTVCRLNKLNITNFKFRVTSNDEIAQSDKIKIDVTVSDNRDKKDVHPYVLSEEDDVYWKNLAVTLIAVLCVLVLLAMAVVLYTCHRFRYSGLFTKCGVDENANEDAENGYVVIHRFRLPFPATPPSSPENRMTSNLDRQQRVNRGYRPKRRLMNEYVDDVFESEDSAGSRSVRLPLEPIPERSETSS